MKLKNMKITGVNKMKKWNELRDYIIQEIVTTVPTADYENALNLVLSKMDELDRKYYKTK
jgi:hypothetical protein